MRQRMKHMMTFREKIRHEQVRRGISNAELARISGVPRTTIQSYLVEQRCIGSAKLEAILVAMKIAPSWLKSER